MNGLEEEYSELHDPSSIVLAFRLCQSSQTSHYFRCMIEVLSSSEDVDDIQRDRRDVQYFGIHDPEGGEIEVVREDDGMRFRTAMSGLRSLCRKISLAFLRFREDLVKFRRVPQLGEQRIILRRGVGAVPAFDATFQNAQSDIILSAEGEGGCAGIAVLGVGVTPIVALRVRA
jgi:hypothetical protein